MNQVQLMGRLTQDPELRVAQTGVSITNFKIAVSRRFQKQGEERQTDFFNIVCFKNTAEFVKKYFVKGQLVALTGSLQTRTWDGQDGKKNYVTEVIADNVYFTGDRRDQADNNKAVDSSDDGFMTVPDDQLPF